MDSLKIILIIAFLGCSVSLTAQDNIKNNDDPYKENYDLRKNLEKKDEDIKKLEGKLAKIESEKNKADSLLKVEKAGGKSEKRKLQKLKQENNRLRSDLDSCSSNTEKTISRYMQSSQERIQALMQQHSNDSMEIASLKGNLEELQNFRKMWIAYLVTSINEKWLVKPFSQIDLTELENELKQYEGFLSIDKRIENAYDTLKVLFDDCQIYNQGTHIVNAPYDKGQIDTIAVLVKNLRDNAVDPDKERELSTLYWQLDNYGITVEIFQDVIKVVDDEIAKGKKDKGEHNVIGPLVMAVLRKQETDNGYLTAIKEIPWLSEQYDAYVNALKENSVGPNEVRDRIMNLQP